MNLRIMLLMWCICIENICYTQSNLGWNYIPDIPSHYDETFSVATNTARDRIVLCSVGFDTLLRQSLIFTELDTFGKILRIAYEADTTGDYISYGSYWGGVISCIDGGYLTVASTAQKRRNLVLKLNAQLQIEFNREIGNDTSLVSNFDFTPKGVLHGFLLYGAVRKTSQHPTDGCLRLIDTAGNLVWERRFDYAPYDERILSVETLNDSIFLIGTVESLTPNQITVPPVGRTGIYQVSISTGAIISEWHSENFPAIGYIRELKKLDDTTLLVYGPSFRYYLPPVGTTLMTRNMITLMDTDYNIIRQDSFGSIVPIGNHPEVKEWMRASDGSMIAVAGGINADFTRLGGRLFKFDPYSLNNIWDTTVFSPLVPSEYDYSQLFDFDTLVSGNIIAVGTARDTFNTYTWVVKVTKDGCVDTLWCNTAVLYEPNLSDQIQFQLYPNPTTYNFNFITDATDLVSLSILDPLSGKRHVVSNPVAGKPIDVSMLPAGFYIIEAICADNALRSAKLIIIR